ARARLPGAGASVVDGADARDHRPDRGAARARPARAHGTGAGAGGRAPARGRARGRGAHAGLHGRGQPAAGHLGPGAAARAGGGAGQPRQPQLRDQPSPADQRRAPGTLPARHRAGAPDLRQRRAGRGAAFARKRLAAPVRRQPQHPRPALPVQQPAGGRRRGWAVRAEDAGARTWLYAALAGWALCAWVLALFGMGGSIDRLEEDPALAQPLPTPVAPAPERLGPLPQYADVAARPLFTEDRRPQPFVIDPTAEPGAGGGFDYVLTSVLRTPQVQLVILQPVDGGDPVRVRRGH